MNDIDTRKLVEGLPVLVPFAEAAKFLNISTRALRGYISTGRIRAFKLSPHRAGKVLIPREALREFLERAAVVSFRDFLPAGERGGP